MRTTVGVSHDGGLGRCAERDSNLVAVWLSCAQVFVSKLHLLARVEDTNAGPPERLEKVIEISEPASRVAPQALAVLEAPIASPQRVAPFPPSGIGAPRLQIDTTRASGSFRILEKPARQSGSNTGTEWGRLYSSGTPGRGLIWRYIHVTLTWVPG